MSQSSTASESRTEREYFNLHTDGIGYLNRLRTVPVQRGQSYEAVDIAALEGRKSEPNYTNFSARLSGHNAARVLEQFRNQINDKETKVLAAFRIGGLNPRVFTFDKGPRAGTQGVNLQTRLIFVKWVKIREPGGEAYRTVYQAPEPEDAKADANTTDAAAA